MRENSNSLKLECLNNNYSTTRLCYKLIDDSYFDENDRIKDKLKFNINNSKFKIQNSKLIGNPEDKFETTLFLPPGEKRKGEGGLRVKGYFKFSYKNLIVNDECLILNDENGNKFGIDNSKLNNSNSTFNIQHSTLNKLPLISIITVVYNGEEYIEKTIQSVLNQTYLNVEYMIIDGGSADGTFDIIKKYEDYIDYWVSEKDNGIYDAMNKGITLASGDFILFLNAGDNLVDNCVLERVVKNIREKNKVYFTRARVVGGQTKWIYPDYNKNIDIWIKRYLPNHQSMFFPKSFYKCYNYDMRLKTTADIDYKLEAKKLGFKFIDELLVEFSLGGISTKCLSLAELMGKVKEIIIRDFVKRNRPRGFIDILKSIAKTIICKIFGYSFLINQIKRVRGYK